MSSSDSSPVRNPYKAKRTEKKRKIKERKEGKSTHKKASKKQKKRRLPIRTPSTAKQKLMSSRLDDSLMFSERQNEAIPPRKLSFSCQESNILSDDRMQEASENTTRHLVYINFVKKAVGKIKLEKACSAGLLYDYETQEYSYPSGVGGFGDELQEIVRDCFDGVEITSFVKKIKRKGQISQTTRPLFEERIRVDLFEEPQQQIL